MKRVLHLDVSTLKSLFDCIFMYIYVLYVCTVCVRICVCMYGPLHIYVYLMYCMYVCTCTVGQNSIVIVLGANLLLSSEDLSAAEEIIAGAKVLICQLEIEHEITLKALQLGKKHGGML